MTNLKSQIFFKILVFHKNFQFKNEKFKIFKKLKNNFLSNF